MRHIMVDLETLGTTPGCAILSIGAVEFFPAERRLGAEFYTVVNRASCAELFLFEETGTVAWWERQGAEAQEVLAVAALASSPSLPAALAAYTGYLGPTPSQVRLYGNGADFDNAILSAAFGAAKMKNPIMYGGRCYRTLKNLDELLGTAHTAPKLARTGTHHNALDDAKSQAMHLMDIVLQIRGDIDDDD